jgi:hypothetical protein
LFSFFFFSDFIGAQAAEIAKELQDSDSTDTDYEAVCCALF